MPAACRLAVPLAGEHFEDAPDSARTSLLMTAQPFECRPRPVNVATQRKAPRWCRQTAGRRRSARPGHAVQVEPASRQPLPAAEASQLPPVDAVGHPSASPSVSSGSLSRRQRRRPIGFRRERPRRGRRLRSRSVVFRQPFTSSTAASRKHLFFFRVGFELPRITLHYRQTVEPADSHADGRVRQTASGSTGVDAKRADNYRPMPAACPRAVRDSIRKSDASARAA